MTAPADLILYHARVLTLDERCPGPPSADPEASAVAVRGERICYVGDEAGAAAYRGPQTELIDGHGGTLIPGFIDAHAHLLGYAESLLSLDCSPSRARSIAQIQELLRQEAQARPKGSWLRAWGYHEFSLQEGRHPTRWDLDGAAPEHPVRLTHHTRHAVVLNSLGLKLAGIGREAVPQGPGSVERDEAGEPTGLLYEMDAYLAQKLGPSLAPGELEEGVRLACQRFLGWGVTSLHEATVHNDLARWRLLGRLQEEGCLPLRLYVMVGFPGFQELREEGLASPGGDHRLRLGAVKFVLSEASGSLAPHQGELEAGVREAHRAGFQVACHVVEEPSLWAALAALEGAQAEAPRPTSRHRLEHCSLCPPEALETMARLGLVVVTQPAFLYYSGQRYRAQVPPERWPWLYRLRSLRERGIPVAASSDSPVAPPNPLVGLYAAITRRAQDGQTLSAGEGLSPREALRAFTAAGAYAAFEEADKGTVTPGKLADLALLSADPTQVPPEQLPELRVELTMVGGRILWSRSSRVRASPS